MTDFLLELASEEIPARMQAAAAEQLRARFVDGCKAAGLAHGEVIADATPRRLWLVAHDVAAASAAAREERKGPAASAPEAAIAGFLRGVGMTREQLEERQTPKGVVLFAHIERPGRPAAAILAELVPGIVGDFQWPKSMRWGAASVATASPRWVRPLTGIVALLGADVVACEAHGVASGRTTRGHRIHAPAPIAIDSAASYADQLRAAKVIVASAERRALIEAGAATAAAAKGLTVIPDAGLVAENAGLTEWPVPLLGSFDPAFLAVPREVIQLTMRTNQKYFALLPSRLRGVEDGAQRQRSGVGEPELAPNFICVANLEASDGGTAVVAGNERVLSARLSDAKFFWDQDVATVQAGGLEAFLPKLEHIVFHEKLGTVADKVERVAKLARWLVESGAILPSLSREGSGVGTRAARVVTDSPTPNPSPEGEGSCLADLAEQAARLCKADLVSATVGEFPEVQGIAGAYLARVAGLDPQVADAIRDHYKPVGQGDEVPKAPVSVAVALADKLDMLVGFFVIAEKPTGSRDPFALRRAALGLLRILQQNKIRLHLFKAIDQTAALPAQAQMQLLVANCVEVVDNATSYIGMFKPLPGNRYQLEVNNEFVKEIGNAELGPYLVALFEGGKEPQWRTELGEFLGDRLKIQQREAGVRHDLIDAFFELGEDDLVRLLARVHALQAFITTDDGANLLAGYKRAANLLKAAEKDSPLPAREGPGVGSTASELSPTAEAARPRKPTPDPSLAGRGEEAVLAAALDVALPAAAAAVAAEDFTAAMTALAGLRAPVDAFFTAVMVNDPDPAIRAGRLALLARFRDAVHSVADFSRIEG